MNDRQRAVEAHVFGTVQGVSYRLWTRSEATGLGLAGWVRNERDGSVTALIAGADAARFDNDRTALDGPAGASVSKVEVEDLKGCDGIRRFQDHCIGSVDVRTPLELIERLFYYCANWRGSHGAHDRIGRRKDRGGNPRGGGRR